MDAQRQMKEDKDRLLRKWEPFLEGITDEYVAENTAMLLENEARYLTEAPAGTAGTTGADVVGLQKIMLPIVRRVFPNLIANNIVSVQPIAAPAGIIFYLRYQYGTNRPGNANASYTGQDFPEYSMYENDPGMLEGYNPYYSSDEVGPFTGVGAAVANGATVASPGPDATQYLSKWPIVAGGLFGNIEVQDATFGSATFPFSYQKGAYVVYTTDRLIPYAGFTVVMDEVAGTVTVKNATGATLDSVTVKTWYKTDLEYSVQIPEMRITIASIPVAVKTRKLKAMWSQESEQDLKAYHGLSADAELTALVSNEMISEIDREIILKCMSIVPQSSRFPHQWNGYVDNNTTGNFLDSHLALMQKVTMASNEIFRKSKIGPANWMIMGTKLSSVVEVLKGFVPNPVTASMGMNIVKAGTYAGRFDVYKDPMFPPDKILMGHKSPASPFGAGVVYSPYVTNLTPVIVGQEDFNPRRGFLARYGLTQVPWGQNLYAMIQVNGLN
jgi:hypothetical protein